MGDVAGEGRTVLFVSHNMAAIEYLCEKGILLDHGKLKYSGNSEDAITYYQEKLMDKLPVAEGTASNVLFCSENPQEGNGFQIKKIEIFERGEPIRAIHTWSVITFRIHYFAPESVRDGSAVLRISNLSNETLLLMSTQPGLNIPMEIKEGDHFVDCVLLDKFPLAAGNYVLGCGLAVPNKEWLCWNEKMVVFQVHERDVFKSGSSPVNKDMLMAIPYTWRV